MKNSALDQIMRNAKKSTKYPENRQDIDNLCAYINILVRYSKKLVQKNPGITGNELHDIILDDMVELSKEYCKKGNVKGALFEYEAVKKLVNNKSKIEEIHEKVKDEKSNPNFIYGYSINKSLENIMEIAQEQIKENIGTLKLFTNEEIEILKKYIKADKNTKLKMMLQYKDIMDLKGLEKFAPILFNDNYISKLDAELKIMQDSFEENLKGNQIEIMKFMGDFFKKYNLINRFTNNSNRKNQEATRANLTYELSTGEYDKEKIGVEELFTKEFLESQDLETILIYSSFWQNRFAKECDSINKAFFALTDMNLWNDIANGKDLKEFDNKTLIGLCKKERTLKKSIKLLIVSLRNNIKEKDISYSEGYATIDPMDEVKKYHDQCCEEYGEIFDEILPDSENIFGDDINQYRTLVGQEENIYRIKNSMIMYKICEMFNSKKTKNWGVIQEEKVNPNTVLIGIDYEGLNMPLRLHIDKDELIKLLRIRNGNTIIPIYEGDKDFYRQIKGFKKNQDGEQETYEKEDELIRTSVLMPINRKQRKSISERIKELKTKGEFTSELRFLEHEEFLANQDKYPEHLKIAGKRPTKKFIDLTTEGIYIKDKDKYVLADEKEVKGGKGGK